MCSSFLYILQFYKNTMSTIAKIIYNLKNIQNGGTHTDDLKLNNRQLEFIVNHFRAALAGQRANSKKSLDGFYQDLTSVKLERTNDFKPYSDKVRILRSVRKLPTFATSNVGGYLVNFVGSRDDFMGAQQSSVSTYNIDLQHPMVKHLYFLNNDYLYYSTRSNSFLREIYVKAVCVDPRAAIAFDYDDATEFLDYNWEYPIPEGLINQLNNMIMNQEYQWMKIIPSDLTNDGKDAQ